MTDGHENASREWTHPAVKALIEQQTKTYGWQFLYLGADQDAIEVGSSIGVAAANSMTYSRGKVAAVMAATSRNIGRTRAAMAAATTAAARNSSPSTTSSAPHPASRPAAGPCPPAMAAEVPWRMTAAEPRMLSVADGPLVATTFGLDAGATDGTRRPWAARPGLAPRRRRHVVGREGVVCLARCRCGRSACAVRRGGPGGRRLHPRSRLSVRGTVLAEVEGTAVRVLEWVDLSPRTRRLDPSEVGRTVARLHLAGTPTSERIINWFSTGMGVQAWRDTHRRLVAAGAPFAAALEALLPDLIAVESVIEPHERPQVCHRDLWCDNVLASADGRVCVIDFENVGPADPSQELAMVLFEFGDDDPQRARHLHAAYVEAGGSGRVSRRATSACSSPSRRTSRPTRAPGGSVRATRQNATGWRRGSVRRRRIR